MAGQKSGKIPGLTPNELDGAEVWSEATVTTSPGPYFLARLGGAMQSAGEGCGSPAEATGYAKGGQVGRVGSFGLEAIQARLRRRRRSN